jgi:hypothetical protein
MNRPPKSHLLSLTEFTERVIPIVVEIDPLAEKLIPSDAQAVRNAKKLEWHFRTLAPVVVKETNQEDAWAGDAIKKLMRLNFADDLWHSHLSDGTPVILIKNEALQRSKIPLLEIIKRSQMNGIAKALEAGTEVPLSILQEYQEASQNMAIHDSTPRDF